MNSSALTEVVLQSRLAKHVEFFERVARPAINVGLNKEDARLGVSRFGGLPDLPREVEWPSHSEGVYRFLGQINFAEVPSEGLSLPEQGLLSLFFFEDPEGESEFFWGDQGYVQGLWVPEGSSIEPRQPPYEEQASPSMNLSFSRTLDLPYDSNQVEAWPFDEEEEALYREIRQSLHKDSDYLLGYPEHRSLGYDPTPEGFVSLLTVMSHEQLEWCWHDEDMLMVFVEPERLAKRDFSVLRSDAG